jgi:hypothetical protein
MHRKTRGTLGTVVTWSAGWALFGLALGALRVVLLSALGGAHQAPLVVLAVPVLRWAVLGAAAGAFFAFLVRRAGRRVPSLEALSARRAAAWGAAAGLALPLGVLAAMLALGPVAWPAALVLGVLGIGVALGAGTAAGTVALARRAPAGLATGPRTPALPPVA